MRIFLAVLAALVAASFVSNAAQASNYTSAKHAIYTVWPATYAGEAMQVIGCETGHTYSPFARSRDGLYFGVFQQGSFQRLRFGFAWNIWAQARSGWKAFKANGFCWTCNSQWPTCGRGLD